MWYIVRLDSSRVATLVKVRRATRVSSSDRTRAKSNYIPVYTMNLGKSNAASVSSLSRYTIRIQYNCIYCQNNGAHKSSGQ